MGRVKQTESFEMTNNDINLDEMEVEQTEKKQILVEKEVKEEEASPVASHHLNKLVNPLRAEKVIVRHLFKESGLFDNPKHVFAGGMAENAIKMYCVPKLAKTGQFVNVLTNSEKEYLEDVLGLQINALSIYNKENNFWTKRFVRLHKEDNVFDLSDPEQYIDYKILLANKEFIAPSLQALEDHPIATYEYVIINESDETRRSKLKMSVMQQCYKEFGKIEENSELLKTIVEIFTGKVVADNVKTDWLHGKINDIIQQDSKMFLKIVTDEYLATKALIRQALNQGYITKRNDYLYVNNEPLCEAGEESTVNNAARYLNNPKHQQLLLSLQEKIK